MLHGEPISANALPQLTAHRGKLLSARTDRGIPVHAASFIRRRQIILESELLRNAALLHVVVHEIFHFVWPRLSNAERAGFHDLLVVEFQHRARGELGESAAIKKEEAGGVLTRDYICESFCDTAAWLYALKPEPAGRLAKRWCRARKMWFETVFSQARNC